MLSALLRLGSLLIVKKICKAYCCRLLCVVPPLTVINDCWMIPYSHIMTSFSVLTVVDMNIIILYV